MLKIKKRQQIQTIYPGIIYEILASPADSLPEDEKQFYIINMIDRNEKDGRVYAVEMIVRDSVELHEDLGLKRNEKIVILA